MSIVINLNMLEQMMHALAGQNEVDLEGLLQVPHFCVQASELPCQLVCFLQTQSFTLHYMSVHSNRQAGTVAVPLGAKFGVPSCLGQNYSLRGSSAGPEIVHDSQSDWLAP